MADEQKNISEEIADTGKSVTKLAVTVGKTAAKVASQDYVGAAVELARSEEVRKTLVAILIASAVLIAAFSSIPNVVFETINSVSKPGKRDHISWEEREEDIMLEAWYGNIDYPAESDLAIFESSDALKTVYERKIQACKDMVNRRMIDITYVITGDEVSDKIRSTLQARFNREELPKSSKTTKYVFDHVELTVTKRNLTTRQAIQLLSLCSAQMESIVGEVKVSTLLRWLGYSPDFTKHIKFPLGSNQNIVGTLPAWSGTLLPQYLIDEAIQRGTAHKIKTVYDILREYQKDYGISAVDYLIVVDCRNLQTIKPIYVQDPPVTVTETVTTTGNYKYYSYPFDPLPVFDEDGYCVTYPKCYHLEWISDLNRYMPVRNATSSRLLVVKPIYHTIGVKIKTEVEYQQTTVHVSYVVTVRLTTRPVSDLADFTGMWSGPISANWSLAEEDEA